MPALLHRWSKLMDDQNRVLRHKLIDRVFHWVTAACFFVLLASNASADDLPLTKAFSRLHSGGCQKSCCTALPPNLARCRPVSCACCPDSICFRQCACKPQPLYCTPELVCDCPEKYPCRPEARCHSPEPVVCDPEPNCCQADRDYTQLFRRLFR